MTTVNAPASLAPEQIQAYHDDGFVVIENMFPPGEVEALRAAEGSPEIQTTLDEMGIKTRTVHLLELTMRHPAFLALARDPRVLACIEPLLGPDIQLQHSKLATKASTRGMGAFGWHQDIVYYPHTNTSLLSVFVYLDDATPENGCMSMVRGSHRLGPLRHHDDKGVFLGTCLETHYWEDAPEKVVAVAPPAGSISIHHCMTLHGSPPNISGRPRRGIVFSYRADDAHQLGDTIFRDTGLVVAGGRRGVVRCEAIAWPLPQRPGANKRNFGSAHFQTGDWAEGLNVERAI
ncbi:MAG TPA: phytanoyl-CoA dioxygenase family protein [Candidatus Methylacidiphilales bacterium]|nr:phytanoyl-CoA dioxygenase family protein [Candidatus Methylacidiphilales bacterium]